jgi:hypothetical protein
VDYRLPIEPLREELNKILKKSPYWDGKVGKLFIANFSERAVEIRILLSAVNSGNFSNLCNEVREKILNFIRENFPDCLPQPHFIQ